MKIFVPFICKSGRRIFSPIFIEKLDWTDNRICSSALKEDVPILHWEKFSNTHNAEEIHSFIHSSTDSKTIH